MITFQPAGTAPPAKAANAASPKRPTSGKVTLNPESSDICCPSKCYFETALVEANYISMRRAIIMTRYKGCTNFKKIEWDFPPLIIEIAVPPSRKHGIYQYTAAPG